MIYKGLRETRLAAGTAAALRKKNVPFAALGAVICILYFRSRNENSRFKPVWSYIFFSFLFYIPVAVGAGFVPILGMLMLPKTVCYILLILTFLISTLKDGGYV